ncbi:hypothetical protein SERLA73DRAFT_72683 [Serpula lacrymans var. lacrymans S7.3]|uniref:CAP-Gly domain-containing protein n=1 Tax=Serpula lacrymans var. lacrymans (strain S7.3) TaxID=936435 RepID=F8PWA2_SERL3|nr:hypothetical protein SERLA73DRAFT_72683 [Serpula lacrymans var. lacrymans S7.3]
MSTTPGKPRYSGIPTPGKVSNIPTPGRFRSSSSAQNAAPDQDLEYMSRAFADAIKSNDPAQHRTSLSSTTSHPPSPPANVSFLKSGRRSVAGRPSSVASSSTANHRKTPARPASRQSDLFGRSVSRAGKVFDIGDNVRIESLGYEGTLRYIGEIEGKAGLWAGVELSGGFSGKGKNNGTVNGKIYFTCPLNCGVFVATAKLSAPTVGLNYRPSSVASSYSGRITPSFSGRITPSSSISLASGRITPSASISNGRVTPSFSGKMAPSISTGRITPGLTPAARARPKPTLQTSTSVPPSSMQFSAKPNTPESKITMGSRASKYVGLTAKQLSTRSPSVGSTSLPDLSSRSVSSPTTQGSLGFNSPTKTTMSPFSTPKASGARSTGLNSGYLTPGSKGRPSLATPRPRVPSAVAMPPPPSPGNLISTRSISLNDDPPIQDTSMLTEKQSISDLENTGQALQDKINMLITGKAVAAGRPASRTSLPSAGSDNQIYQVRIDDLESRIDSLQRENATLREGAVASKPEDSRAQELVSAVQTELDAALKRITDLESELRTSDRSLKERESKVESLERSSQEVQAELNRTKSDTEMRLADLQVNLTDRDNLVKTLKEAIETKEGVEHETNTILKAKNVEISSLELRNEKLTTESEHDRREINELRQAGQETIALYEERLSEADTKRYELEDRIVVLEDQVKKSTMPMSPSAALQRASSAAEIDNENLREQVQHLQRKISSLEDTLEDVRTTSEREEVAIRERIRRYKDKEEAMKNELNEGRREVEQILKAETLAKGRVEEVEEALRESTLALENAQAEIEGLRAELTNLDNLVTGAGVDTPKSPEAANRAAIERARLTEEISELRTLLEQSRAATREVTESFAQFKAESEKESTSPTDREAEQILLSLRQTLEERTLELEALKKRLNREVSVSGPPSTPSKSQAAATREEITGLKHIVQELQKENVAAAQRNRVLEAENKLLLSELSETEQLRQELKQLEEHVEQSLLHEEAILEAGSARSPGLESSDMVSLQMAFKEQKVKYELEIEQLRKRLNEVEMKHARITHDLNKEISELEALVESKIYHEDELEQEVERLKEKLTRKKSSKNSLEPMQAGKQRDSSSTASISSMDSLSGHTQHIQVCEICERPGHDIFNCDLLKDDATPNGNSKLGQPQLSVTADPSDLFCVDCESHGHIAADCPHSMDVF